MLGEQPSQNGHEYWEGRQKSQALYFVFYFLLLCLLMLSIAFLTSHN